MQFFTFFICLFLGLHIKCKSQPIAFKEIEYASFDVNSYRTSVRDSVFLQLYCSIDSSGLIKVYNPKDLQASPKIYYSCQLSAAELEKINSIFNAGKLLKSYIVKTKLMKNALYAGSYDFYRVSYLNNSADSICSIVPFVSDSFREIDNILSNHFYSGKGRSKIDRFNVPGVFLASLKNSYSVSKYLPEIETLPAFIPGKQN